MEAIVLSTTTNVPSNQQDLSRGKKGLTISARLPMSGFPGGPGGSRLPFGGCGPALIYVNTRKAVAATAAAMMMGETAIVVVPAFDKPSLM